MPRGARDALGGYCYHVLNRGNGRRTVFHKDGDFAAFVKLLREAGEGTDMRLLAYGLMGNHFHLLLWPRQEQRGHSELFAAAAKKNPECPLLPCPCFPSMVPPVWSMTPTPHRRFLPET